MTIRERDQEMFKNKIENAVWNYHFFMNHKSVLLMKYEKVSWIFINF